MKRCVLDVFHKNSSQRGKNGCWRRCFWESVGHQLVQQVSPLALTQCRKCEAADFQSKSAVHSQINDFSLKGTVRSVQVVDDTSVFWVFFRLKYCSTVWFRLRSKIWFWIFYEIFRNILSNVLSLHAFLSFECSVEIIVFFRRKLEKLLQGKGTTQMFKGTVIVYRWQKETKAFHLFFTSSVLQLYSGTQPPGSISDQRSPTQISTI